MKILLYIVAVRGGAWSILLLLRGIERFGAAASSAGPEAQGGAVGVILFAVVLAAVAWKAFSKARAS